MGASILCSLKNWGLGSTFYMGASILFSLKNTSAYKCIHIHERISFAVERGQGGGSERLLRFFDEFAPD